MERLSKDALEQNCAVQNRKKKGIRWGRDPRYRRLEKRYSSTTTRQPGPAEVTRRRVLSYPSAAAAAAAGTPEAKFKTARHSLACNLRGCRLSHAGLVARVAGPVSRH